VSPVVPATDEELAEGARPISAIPARYAARMKGLEPDLLVRAFEKA
jgi:hypothetical protein